MAEAVAIRAALQRMGCTQAAALLLTDNQEMDELAEFALLKDDEVENLCKVIRRPGGTMPNPNAAVDGQPAQIPNPGSAVSLRAENNLKLMCYFLRYKDRTSRGVVAGDVTLANVRALRDHKEWEENHTDVDAPEINTKDWPRTIEAIEEYLRGCLGVSKIPLAYIVRAAVAVPEGADPAGNYDSKQDELIARAPHVDADNEPTATYLADRLKVWELISDLTREHDCWTYVRPAQRSRNGRMAFVGLKGHYLGANNVDNMSSKAEKRLQSTSYGGEKRRWDFEKYVKVHVDQHAILEGLTVHGYAGIDDRSKVRHLLAGIKTNTLDTVKTRIMSDADLRSDFDSCVNLFQDFIEQTAHNVPDALVAAIETEDGSNDVDVEPDKLVEDQSSKELTLSKETIEALALAIKSRESTTEDSDSHSSDDNEEGSSDDNEEDPKNKGPAKKKQKSERYRGKSLKRKS